MKPLIFQVYTQSISRLRDVKLTAVSVPFALLQDAWSFADHCWNAATVVVEFTAEGSDSIKAIHTQDNLGADYPSRHNKNQETP